MSLFLQILGALCLGAVVLLVLLIVAWRLVVWVFRKKLMDAMDPFQYAHVPPRLHLGRRPRIEWKDPAAVLQQADALHGVGFSDAGLFVPHEVPYLRIHALVRPEDSAWAVVYEHDKAGIWTDLYSRYEDGTGVTYTTAPMGAEVESPPGCTKVTEPGADLAELYHRFLGERRTEGLVAASADTFASIFEKAYAQSMDWRNSRGGPTEEEIRRTLEASGEEVTEEAVAAVRAMQLEQALEGLEVALRERFLATTRLSAAEWEAVDGRLLFIHDLLPEERVALLFYQAQGGDEDDEDVPEIPPALRGLPARQLFARLNETAPPDRRFEKLDELSQPLPADVYASPETDEPPDLDD